MKKEIFEKKLKALSEYKEQSPEYDSGLKTSESGNHYISTTFEKECRTYNAFNVTKSGIDKLGTIFEFPSQQNLIMLTKTGKFIVKEKGQWKNITKNYKDLYYIGRKCEWVLQFEELQKVRVARQFSSLNNFKKWLGYEFISDDEFSSLIYNIDNIELLIKFKLKDKNERVNLISLLNLGQGSTLKDTLTMVEQLQQTCSIPRGATALKELHDDLSKQIKVKNTPFVEVEVSLTKFNIPWDYKIIQTSYELVERGIINKHCIGSYYYRLDYDLFLVIEGYDCHIASSGGWKVSQMRGFANKQAPQDMIETIDKALKKCSVGIKTVSKNEVEMEEMLF
jgi:hypothetical protein